MPIDPVAFHDFEQAGWQRAAEYYPGSFGTLTSQATEPLLDAAGGGPGVRGVGVAAGARAVAAGAGRRGAAVVAGGFSPLLNEGARGGGAGPTLVAGAAE